MSCKLSDKCDNVFACNVLRPEVELLGCSFYKPKKPMTNEEWMRSATFEELAGAIYEWHTKGYARGRLEAELNPITEVVEWLKEIHHAE